MYTSFTVKKDIDLYCVVIVVPPYTCRVVHVAPPFVVLATIPEAPAVIAVCASPRATQNIETVTPLEAALQLLPELE